MPIDSILPMSLRIASVSTKCPEPLPQAMSEKYDRTSLTDRLFRFCSPWKSLVGAMTTAMMRARVYTS